MAESDSDDGPPDWGASSPRAHATQRGSANGAPRIPPLGTPEQARRAGARAGRKLDAEWVQEMHDNIQREAAEHGIQAFKWECLLDKWSEHIRDAPYERVDLTCVKQILQYARLTSASASPMNYETLRRLGNDILAQQVDENLLERLKPQENDTKYYKGFFGREVMPTPRTRLLLSPAGIPKENFALNEALLAIAQTRTLLLAAHHPRPSFSPGRARER